MIDIKQLEASADPYIIAKYIGMEVVEKGKYKYIRCPGHYKRLGKEDRKISNAILTNHGYRCFACNCNVGIFDMVQEFCNCNFATALNTVADAMGGADLYTLDNTKPKNTHNKNVVLPLTIDELHDIGLVMSLRINSYPPQPAKTLLSFYSEHPLLFKRMLLGKCDEKINEYKMKMKKLDRSDKNFAEVYELIDFGDGVNESDLLKLKNKISEKISNINQIRKKVESI